jgi:hypothetical protein
MKTALRSNTATQNTRTYGYLRYGNLPRYGDLPTLYMMHAGAASSCRLRLGKSRPNTPTPCHARRHVELTRVFRQVCVRVCVCVCVSPAHGADGADRTRSESRVGPHSTPVPTSQTLSTCHRHPYAAETRGWGDLETLRMQRARTVPGGGGLRPGEG